MTNHIPANIQIYNHRDVMNLVGTKAIIHRLSVQRQTVYNWKRANRIPKNRWFEFSEKLGRPYGISEDTLKSLAGGSFDKTQ